MQEAPPTTLGDQGTLPDKIRELAGGGRGKATKYGQHGTALLQLIVTVPLLVKLTIQIRWLPLDK